jgi:hypothetical protein
MSEFVQVFGCRHDEAIHALRRPASEKRQGTKSREVGHRRCREGRLTQRLINNTAGAPSSETVVNHFGSLHAAYACSRL